MKPSPMIKSAAERHQLELCAYDVLAMLIDQYGLETVLSMLRYWLVVTTMQGINGRQSSSHKNVNGLR